MMTMSTTNNCPTNPADWTVGTSSGLFDPLTLADMNACRSAGVNALEIILFGHWLTHYSVDLPAICRTVQAQAKQAEIEVWSMHLPFGLEWDISEPDPALRQAYVAKNLQILAEAAVLNPRKVVIHPSCEPITPEQRPARIMACRESLQVLSRRTAEMGMQLAVECLPRTCLGNSAAELLSIVEGIPDLGVCCDVNHAFQETAQDFIRKIGPRLATIHVSDYDGVDERHWLPGRGINDWTAIIQALAAVGYTGPFLFEIAATTVLQPLTPQVLADCWQDLLQSFGGSVT